VKLKDLEAILVKYIPEQSVPWVGQQIDKHGVHLSIKGGRSSKLGDYRSPYGGKGHRISVNLELNKEEFLVTFVHELAHLLCFEKHKHNVKPHGWEWKNIYIQVIHECMQLGFFSDELLPHLQNHIQSPGASSCSDPGLRAALRKEDPSNEIELHQLEEGTLFALGNHLFKKGTLQRTRFRCLNVKNKRYYLVNKHAPVSIVDRQSH
jgi:SprT protein